MPAVPPLLKGPLTLGQLPLYPLLLRLPSRLLLHRHHPRGLDGRRARPRLRRVRRERPLPLADQRAVGVDLAVGEVVVGGGGGARALLRVRVNVVKKLRRWGAGLAAVAVLGARNLIQVLRKREGEERDRACKGCGDSVSTRN